MNSLVKFKKEVNLSGYIFIIPSVSVGNVPQLTIDLLINTYSFEKIGSLWHPAIVCTVGSDPYNNNSKEICTACELYSNSTMKLACLQLRSTLDNSLAKKFFEDIFTTLKGLKLKKIVILSSAFDYELHNINKERFYFLNNYKEKCFRGISNLKELEAVGDGKYKANGAGFSLNLYKVISSKLKCCLIGKYISEGDNRPDAESLLEILFCVLGLESNLKNFEYPLSWACLFGGPPPIGMY